MSAVIETQEVRRRISTNLALLRSLTRALLHVAQAAEREERQRPLICDVLAQLSSEMDRHIAYEEEVVLPILRSVDAWGTVRADQLCREHDEQRSFLVTLAADAQAGVRNVEDLTDEIEWFYARFERVMSDEEDGLLNAESIGAGPCVDQVDG